MLCLGLCLGVLAAALPRGFALGGVDLGFPVQAALMGASFVAGAWGAFSGKDRRVLLGGVLALLLLVPAYDPRAPLERLPLYLVAGILFVLYLEFSLLNAKVTRLAALPRAHVTQVGQAREVELQATASRIAQSWPTPFAMALGLLAGALLLQAGLSLVAPPALGRSIEMQGPFGFALASIVVLGGLGLWAARRKDAAEAGPEDAAPAPADQGA